MSMKISLLPDPTVTTSIVLIDETVSGTTTSVQYLNIGVDSSGKVRLLRCNASDQRQMNNVNVAHYDGCGADLWMNNESTGYLARLNSATRNALSSTSIKVKDENDGTIYEIARRCFIPSYSEYGYGGSDEGASYLPILKTWKNTTNSVTARNATTDNGTLVSCWLRTPNSLTEFLYPHTVYDRTYAAIATSSNNYLRPCISFDPDTLVSDPDENGICYLLPDPDKPYREAGLTIKMGSIAKTPVEGLLRVQHSGCMTGYPQCFITTTYNNPVWQEVPLNEPFDIEGNGKDLGVKIYARTQSQCRIQEPILTTGGEKDDS